MAAGDKLALKDNVIGSRRPGIGRQFADDGASGGDVVGESAAGQTW
jgi:hypothetical protein